MAVPNSGELFLKNDILQEVSFNNTGSNPGGPDNNPSASLHLMSVDTGKSTPDAMSDFYGYVSANLPTNPGTVTSNRMLYISTNEMSVWTVINNPSGAPTNGGYYFGTNANVPTNNTKYTELTNATGTHYQINSNKTGLSSSTTHYAWAWATNAAGTWIGVKFQGTTQTPTTYTVTNSPSNSASTVYVVSQTTGNVDTYFYGQYQHANYGWNTNSCSHIRFQNGSQTKVSYQNADGNYTNVAYARMPRALNNQNSTYANVRWNTSISGNNPSQFNRQYGNWTFQQVGSSQGSFQSWSAQTPSGFVNYGGGGSGPSGAGYHEFYSNTNVPSTSIGGGAQFYLAGF